MRVTWFITLTSVLGLPLLATFLVQGDTSFLFAFPPELDRVNQRPFNPRLTLVALLFFGCLAAMWFLTRRRDRLYRHSLVVQRRHFPRWGYAGYLLLFAAWIFAWSRFSFLVQLQAYTFTPLWLGFILVVNAHVHQMSNSAPIHQTQGKFLGLFVLSAGFWWGFEFLNRFSENWIYTGVEGVSAAEYYIHGTICFSTVLPALYSVFQWLHGFDALHRCFYIGPRLRILQTRSFGLTCLIAGWLGLAGLGIWPEFAYPFLWLGPVLIYGGLRVALGKFSGISNWARGDWRWVLFWGLAGVICGFFWELWNFGSLLHWEYRVSFFDGWKIFEMPLLGYAGYIPFGIFCGLITQWIFPREASIQFSPNG